jgi:hypothetical protein
METIVTLAILIVLAILGTGLILSSLTLVRDYGRPGFLAFLSGVGLLALTYFFIMPALLDHSDGSELIKLRADLQASKNKTAEAERQVSEINAQLNRATAARIDTAALLETSLSSIEGDTAKVVQQYSEAESRVYLERAASRMAAGPSETPAQHLTRIRSTLEALRHLKSREPFAPAAVQAQPAPTARMDDTRDLMQLKDSMSTRRETPSYDVEVYPDKELIGGRKGKYYVVDLKDAANGIRYYFEGGKYSIPRSDAEFRKSLNTFVADVLSKMEGKVRYDLFVRGSADKKPYSGTFEKGLKYEQLVLLKNAGNDRYLSEPQTVRLDQSVRNTDLPNLRAAFMRDVVAETYPIKPPLILEGAVSSNTSDRDRNVELILFADW